MNITLNNSLWFIPLSVISYPAAAVNYFSVEQAQQVLFPEADQFISANISFTDDDKEYIKKHSGVRQRQDSQPIWQVFKDKKPIGWFIVDDVVGKHEYITYALALNEEGRVLGIEIMSYRETHGDEIRQQSWRNQFVDKQLGDAFKLDEDIINISGATLSCRNVTDGVHRLLVMYQYKLQKQ
ncbi:FMN-binding protein [Thalassotalea ganghwensis]